MPPEAPSTAQDNGIECKVTAKVEKKECFSTHDVHSYSLVRKLVLEIVIRIKLITITVMGLR